MEAKTSAIFLSVFTLKGFTSRSRKLSAVTKQLNHFFFHLGRRQFEYALYMIKKEPLISRVRKELGKLPSSKRCQTYNSWLQYVESKIQSLQFS